MTANAKHARKAIVLAAGAGTRMRAAGGHQALAPAQLQAAATGAKAMMPVAGRPFLDFSLHNLAEAGIDQVCLIVAPEHGAIREYYEALAPKRLSIQFAVQASPQGTAHALLSGEAFAQQDPFLLVNGDNLYPVAVLARLCQSEGPALAAFGAGSVLAASIPSEEQETRLRAFAALRLDDSGNLADIEEKPALTPIWVSMNAWRLDTPIFSACRAIEPSARGEFELPSAVLHSMHSGHQIYAAQPARGPVLDLSSRQDIASVQTHLANTEIAL